MFEDTVLRFADKERQQQLAELEQALEQRRTALEARQKNLAYRQDWMKKDPVAVSQAIERDDRERKEERRMALDASEIKKRFGLKDRELIDTAAMRGALENALAEKDVQQQMQADRITDRSSLLSGLNRLALIDAAKAAEILQANKEINPPREYTRQEIGEMFAKAQSHVDAHGRKHGYAKTLDGWAQSLEARKRELELAEIKLDAQEQALRAQVKRTLEATQEKAAQPATEQAIGNETQLPADKGQESKGPATGAQRGKDETIDTSPATLNDPKKFEAAVAQTAKVTGQSLEQARQSLESIRDIRASMAAASPGKADIDQARAAFFARGEAISQGKVVDMNTRRDRAAEHQSGPVVQQRAEHSANKGTVESPSVDGAKSRAALGIDGFRSLNRNRTKSAAEKADEHAQGATQEAIAAAAGRTARTVSQEQGRDAAMDGRAASNAGKHGEFPERGSKAAGERERPTRRNFRELNAHERIERRASFFGDLREAAGFTRDGKQALSEKAKESVRPGKQRDGYGVA